MNNLLKVLVAVGFACGGVGIFIYAARDNMLNADGIQRATLQHTTLRIGRTGPSKCSVDIPVTAWARMNELRVYAWITACEEKTHE